MSLFDELDTLCNREGNNCKRRNKCRRYMTERADGLWIADYWPEFGKFCNHFQPIVEAKKRAEVRKASESF